MTLEPGFAEQTEKYVTDTLRLYKTAGASPRIASVWGAQRVGDFLCGFLVGQLVGTMLGGFQATYRREPTPEEHMEIVRIIEGHAEEIKEFFGQFNE